MYNMTFLRRNTISFWCLFSIHHRLCHFNFILSFRVKWFHMPLGVSLSHPHTLLPLFCSVPSHVYVENKPDLYNWGGKQRASGRWEGEGFWSMHEVVASIWTCSPVTLVLLQANYLLVEQQMSDIEYEECVCDFFQDGKEGFRMRGQIKRGGEGEGWTLGACGRKGRHKGLVGYSSMPICRFLAQIRLNSMCVCVEDSVWVWGGD